MAPVMVVARDPRLRAHAKTLLRILVVAAAYFVGAKVGLMLALVQGQVTPLWPPTGIAIVSMLLWGPRVWPGITIGAFLANVSIVPSFLALTAISVGNTAAAVAAFLLLRAVGFRKEIDRLRDGLALVFLAAFAAMLVSATIGTTALVLTDPLAATRFWPTWSVWWTGDAMGVLVVSPLLLAVSTAKSPWRQRRGWWFELVALFLSTMVVSVLATRNAADLLFLAFPFLIWASLRFQLIGAAPCALIVSCVAILAAAEGIGPFGGLSLLAEMITLQAFNGCVALTALLLSAITTERDEASRAVERACTQLAGAVARYESGSTLLKGRLLDSVRAAQRRHRT
jgi:integral membrane sensor domain MASE1